jgi:hypothetical protein
MFHSKADWPVTLGYVVLTHLALAEGPTFCLARKRPSLAKFSCSVWLVLRGATHGQYRFWEAVRRRAET